MDNNLKIGDIVTGYHKGYWKITNITRRFYDHNYFKYSSYEQVEPEVYRYKYEPYNIIRIGDEYTPLIEYVQVAKDDFTLYNGKQKKYCDANYCTVITQVRLRDMLTDYVQRFQTFEEFVAEYERVKQARA